MSDSLPWLVLFFFAIISAVVAMIYEIRSKFKWKEQTFIFEKEIEKLKIQVANSTNLEKEFDFVLQRIKNQLTKRQFEIFLLTVEGLSSKEIEEKINISSGTINWHINDIKTNLRVEKRSQFANVLLNELKKTFKS